MIEELLNKVVNILAKGEIAHYELFSFSTLVIKSCFTVLVSESVCIIMGKGYKYTCITITHLRKFDETVHSCCKRN